MSDLPYVTNPDAIGNPDETPVVHAPEGAYGDWLVAAVLNNKRLLDEEAAGHE